MDAESKTGSSSAWHPRQVDGVCIGSPSFLEIQRENVFSAVASEGENVVLASLVFYPEAESKPGMFDVHFLDKYVAGDRHPSGYIKAETRKPTKTRILLSRVIDRSLRPLVDSSRSFQLMVRLLSVDKTIPPVKSAVLAAGEAALKAGILDSPIYFFHHDDGERFLMASFCKRGLSMVEAGLNEMPDHQVRAIFNEAFAKASDYFDSLNVGEWSPRGSLLSALGFGSAISAKRAVKLFSKHYLSIGNHEGRSLLSSLKDLDKECLSQGDKAWMFAIFRAFCRSYGRFDGRSRDEIRAFSMVPFPIPRPLASVLVTRGDTKVLTSLTSSDEPQSLDEIFTKAKKEYLNVQYDMLGHSVGETARVSGHSRREVGHGNIVYNSVRSTKLHTDRSLYVQNDVISCAGSSSMASVIGTSAAMIISRNSEKLVAGVAVGSLDGETQVMDIASVEDWLGFMDFKVAGTSDGITGMQADFKFFLPNQEFVEKTIAMARVGLNRLIALMGSALQGSGPREGRLSERSRSIFSITEAKIKNVIGYKGFNIKKIVEIHDVKINVDKEKFEIAVEGPADQVPLAVAAINALMSEPEHGAILEATVMWEQSPGTYLVQPEGAMGGLLRSSDVLAINSKISVKVREKKGGKVFYEVLS